MVLDQTMKASPKLPDLPLINLGNADMTTTSAAFAGQNAIIDFWTTKCTICPAALDELNILANDERYQQIKFSSICCDSCDGARNIIDQNDTPRWDKMSHYFMEHEYKELAKSMLGFKQVPFYVVLNVKGEIVQMGPKKHIDFDNLPGMNPDVLDVTVNEKKEGRLGMSSPTSATDELFQAFQVDDLDF